MPLAFKYTFIYFALYQYCLKNWNYSKNWPEFYAALLISVSTNFLLWAILFNAHNHAGWDIYQAVLNTRALSWLPDFLKGSLPFFVVLALNVHYFVVAGHWRRCLKLYENKPKSVLRKNYWVVGILFLGTVAIYWISALAV